VRKTRLQVQIERVYQSLTSAERANQRPAFAALLEAVERLA
jgi:hypothetical protein